MQMEHSEKKEISSKLDTHDTLYANSNVFCDPAVNFLSSAIARILAYPLWKPLPAVCYEIVSPLFTTWPL